MPSFLARRLPAAVLFAASVCGAPHAAPALASTAAPAPAADDVTVYAVGDIARCAYHDPKYAAAAGTADTVAAGLKADPKALVLTLGDNTYPVGAMKEFTDCYDPTWGRFKDRTWPSPGNHEYYTRGAVPYFQYFGARAAHGWYSLQIGSWHVISLDSNVTGAAHAAQIEWLRADLASHPARCTLAFWHHPLYSSGGHGNQAIMHDAWELLAQAGAELVLSGHDHDYERFAPQDADGHVDEARGIRQFVVGTGGAYPTPFLLTVKHSELRDASRTGVLKLRLRDGGYDWEFLESSRVTTLGVAPPDKGSGACH